jgi:muconate cycloisomerase
MKIDEINIYRILVPFSVEFCHSLKKGSSATFAKNVIVEVIAERGEIKGYGEGTPRPYVTGETQESVNKSINCFLQQDSFPWELNDVSQIWNFVDGLHNGKKHNSAICALEISLLDALGKTQDKSILEYLPQDFFNDTIYYGVGVPIADKQRVMDICQLIKKMKIKKLKLKMGQDFAENREIIETVSSIFGHDYDLKIDLNGAWNRDLAFEHIPLIEEYNVKVVEQPMMPDDPDIAEFAEALQDHSAVLMADESACSLGDIERMIEEAHYKMVNVRLSKCGGFRNSLKIIDHLRQKGVSFQVGCHLGESGLLSAAGRALSVLCRDAIYYDGSYDQFLLKENITSENVSFGPRGEAGPLEGPGLGVKVSRQNLRRLSTDSVCVSKL